MSVLRKFNYQIPDLVDKKSSSTRVIESDHAHVHDGASFCAGVYNLAVANNSYLQMQMIIPAGVEIHVKDAEFFAVDVPHVFNILEKPTTITNGTTEVCQCNRYRNHSDESVVELYSDPTGISGGVELPPVLFGGGSGVGGTSAGGGYGHKLEWVLEEGIYVFRVQNKCGSPTAIGMNINWYQVID